MESFTQAIVEGVAPAVKVLCDESRIDGERCALEQAEHLAEFWGIKHSAFRRDLRNMIARATRS